MQFWVEDLRCGGRMQFWVEDLALWGRTQYWAGASPCKRDNIPVN